MLEMIDKLRAAAHDALEYRNVQGDPTAAIEALDDALVDLIAAMTGVENDMAIREALAEFYGEA